MKNKEKEKERNFDEIEEWKIRFLDTGFLQKAKKKKKTK